MCLFQLKDYAAVVRDTERNIDVSIEGHPDAVVRIRKTTGMKGAADRKTPKR